MKGVGHHTNRKDRESRSSALNCDLDLMLVSVTVEKRLQFNSISKIERNIAVSSEGRKMLPESSSRPLPAKAA